MSDHFRMPICAVILFASVLVELVGAPQYELRVSAQLSARRGYEPTSNDYAIKAFDHGFPFVYMRRFAGPGSAPQIASIPSTDRVPLEFLEFPYATTRWPIDGAPVLMLNSWALAGNAAIVLILVWSFWGLLSLQGFGVNAKGLPEAAGELSMTTKYLPQRTKNIVPITVATLGLSVSVAVFFTAERLRTKPASQSLEHSNVRAAFQESEAIQQVSHQEQIVTFQELEGRPGDQRADNLLNTTLIWCPPGRFERALLLDEDQTESRTSIRIDRGFWIGKYEVTQSEWCRLMSDNPSFFQKDSRPYDSQVQNSGISRSLHEFEDRRRREALAGMKTDRFPVECVSWDDAIEFCEALTKKEHRAGRLNANWHYTLPTEDQWEYACRSGTSTRTAFGDQLTTTQANFDGRFPRLDSPKSDCLERTTIIGSYAPNALGICDMHGNVGEWCRNPYLGSHAVASDTAQSSELATDFVGRGGCYLDDEVECWSANRYGVSRTEKSPGIGFRVVLTRVPQ